MGDILKEAIADAKAVRETALENAKMALEEAFTPQLKSMLSAKLQEEDDEEGTAEETYEDEEVGDEEPAEEGSYSEDEEMGDEEPAEEGHGGEEEEVPAEEGEHAEDEVEEDDDDDDDDDEGDLDLEAIIRELEEELDDEGEEVEESTEAVSEGEDEDEEPVEEEYEITLEGEDEDEVDEAIEEQEASDKSSGIGKSDNHAGETDISSGVGKGNTSLKEVQSELNEYKEAVHFLKGKLNELNILNAKLLFTNKLFKSFSLNNNQKLKVVETFDRAQTTREIKLIYSTLCEQFVDNGSIIRKNITESASAKSGSTKPSKESKKVITEEQAVANRFKKLAGLN